MGKAANFACYRYYSLLPDEPSEVVMAFEPMDGGSNRACRGNDAWDNSDQYFVKRRAGTLETCEALCLALDQQCHGVEYHLSGRCDLWTRSMKATTTMYRHQCFVRKK